MLKLCEYLKRSKVLRSQNVKDYLESIRTCIAVPADRKTQALGERMIVCPDIVLAEVDKLFKVKEHLTLKEFLISGAVLIGNEPAFLHFVS